MKENSHRAPHGAADATEKLDATENLGATLGAEPTEVLTSLNDPTSTAPTTTAASPRVAAPASEPNVEPSIPRSATATPSKAPEQPARRRRSFLAPVIVVLGLIATVLLAIYSWGGIFTTAQLACVIAGAALFALTGILAVRTCKSTAGLIIAWILAFVLLFAPLLVAIFAQGGPALTSTLIFGAIGMWVSGVAAVALVVAVVGTFLHARAAAR